MHSISPVLSMSDVRKGYRKETGERVEIIKIREFSLSAGEQVALVGHSGQGKSTLLNLVAGILLPDKGQIVLNGTDITRLSEAKRDLFRARHIGYVFQSFNLLQGFTAFENVLLGQVFSPGGGLNDPKQVRDLLQSVGLSGRLDHKPRALSVGEQQRVAIARAMVNEPPLVLADEPTGSLDAKNGAQVLELLKTICEKKGHTLLLVTHDPSVMEQFKKVVKLEELQ